MKHECVQGTHTLSFFHTHCKTGTYIGKFSPLQYNQLYRVSHFNPAGIVLTAFVQHIVFFRIPVILHLVFNYLHHRSLVYFP